MKNLFLALILACSIAAANAATADTFSTTSLGFTFNTGTNSSSASADGGDSIGSVLFPISGSSVANMGAAYNVVQGAFPGDSNEFYPLGRTNTTHNDDWFITCASKSPCTSIPTNLSTSLAVSFSGVLSPSQISVESGGQLTGDYSLSTGDDFNFTISQGVDPDVGGVGVSGQADWCPAGAGLCQDVPVNFILNSDGNYSFSVSFTANTVICATGCPLSTQSCSDDSCSANIAFSDSQSITAQFFTDQYTGFLDAMDPFSVELVSNDPNYLLESADGRISGALPGGVPEPATWAMILMGFGGLGVAARRRRASFQRAQRAFGF